MIQFKDRIEPIFLSFISYFLIIYLIYIGVLIPRIMIEFIFVGPQGYLFINQAQQGVHLKATISSVAIATDFILMFGAGLLVGRNIKIMERYSKIKHGSELR